MNANTLSKFNRNNSRRVLGILLSACLSSVYALDSNELSSANSEATKLFNSTLYPNEVISTPQDQNETELALNILKTIEDKKITETNKKISFVNTFNLPDEIKKYAKSLITQNLNYSDFKKESYGTYTLIEKM